MLMDNLYSYDYQHYMYNIKFLVANNYLKTIVHILFIQKILII